MQGKLNHYVRIAAFDRKKGVLLEYQNAPTARFPEPLPWKELNWLPKDEVMWRFNTPQYVQVKTVWRIQR